MNVDGPRPRRPLVSKLARAVKDIGNLAITSTTKWVNLRKIKDLPELYKADLLKFGGMMQLGEKPAKTSSRMTAVKNTKKMPGAFDKPSKFFKSEDALTQPKHPSLQKLRDFMLKKHKAS